MDANVQAPILQHATMDVVLIIEDVLVKVCKIRQHKKH